MCLNLACLSVLRTSSNATNLENDLEKLTEISHLL